MAQAFGSRPSAFYGLTDEAEQWLALSVDRATWTWGATVERWQRETKQVPPRKAPKNAPMDVPKYTEHQIARMIYGPLPGQPEVAQRGSASPLPNLPGLIDPRIVAALEPDETPTPQRFRGQDIAHLIATMPKGEKPG